MPYFVYIRRVEDGKIVRFGTYDTIPMILAQEGNRFVELTEDQFQNLPSHDN